MTCVSATAGGDDRDRACSSTGKLGARSGLLLLKLEDSGDGGRGGGGGFEPGVAGARHVHLVALHSRRKREKLRSEGRGRNGSGTVPAPGDATLHIPNYGLADAGSVNKQRTNTMRRSVQ
jgi:hypothetical protein